MHIEPFFDATTGTVSYVLADPASGQVAVIDPVLDFEPKSGTLTSASSDRIIDYVRAQGWQVQWILETHAHADHLSGAQHIRHHLGGQIAIGVHIREVQKMFRSIFHFEHAFVPDGSQFDHLLTDGEQFQLGKLTVTALHVPGHTPADMAYHVQDAVFTGDTLFMPDVGTARDATLDMPTLILPAVQVNVRAGKLPPAADDGRTYMQTPINAFLRGAGAPDGVFQATAA